MASELTTGDELVLAEMVFNGDFRDLTPEQAACIISCFIWREKSEVGENACIAPLSSTGWGL